MDETKWELKNLVKCYIDYGYDVYSPVCRGCNNRMYCVELNRIYTKGLQTGMKTQMQIRLNNAQKELKKEIEI